MTTTNKTKADVKEKKKNPSMDREKARKKVKDKGVLKYRKQIQEATKYYK